MNVEIFQTQDPLTARLVATFGVGYFTRRQLEMFDHSQKLGPVYVGLVDNIFVACWGIAPPTFMSDDAYLWFWAPPVRFPITLLRHSKKAVDLLLDRYDLLRGHCHVGALHSRRWMQWLGAEFGQPNGTLIPFEIRRP
jgi:hypothetical protein